MLCAPGGAIRNAAVALTFASTIALVGCSGGERADGTLPTAPPTTVAVTTTTVVATTTVAASTTVTVTSTEAPAPATTAVAAGVGLSADGPWRLVDSAPGVTTPGLVYELIPKLWAFIQLEETDTSTYPWTLNDTDRPIIEAYLQAQLTYYQAITSNPIDLDLPGWTQFYSGESAELVSLRERKAQGQNADLDLGVVLRPEVLGDERSDVYAIVSDCVLDGSTFRLPDGSFARGSSSGVGELAWGARLSLIDGRWLVDEMGPIEGGCDQ